MADIKKEKTTKLNSKEPVFIIRPASKHLGLDYLHILLIALVIILVVLSFALSTFQPAKIVTNCQYGTNANSTCNSTVHNSSQALSAAEHYFAAYSSINTSLSLIPYYLLVNESQVSYLAGQKEWLVTVPYIDPLVKNKQFNISLLLYDSNLSLASSFLQTLKPVNDTNDSVVALGTVNLAGESACKTTKPIPVYVVSDPYAPGTISSIFTAINQSKAYTSSINVSYFFIFSGYSQHFYAGYGQDETQLMGRYLSCASGQSNFPQFLSNLSIAYTGLPLSNATLYQVMLGSNLNATKFGDCMSNVTARLNYESEFANLYNIVSTPTVIVNCRYSTLPQTLPYAINYSLKNLNG